MESKILVSRLTILLLIIMPGLLRASIMVRDSLSAPVFFERLDDNQLRLFYDERYFLVDKDCHYKAIEREGVYDFKNNTFVGEVFDYDLDGLLIMQGTYSNGMKEGLFRAYHRSGFLKWEIYYHQDVPKDTIRFYYPDGAPYLVYRVTEDRLLLWNYWDQRGRQRVKDGRGRFDVVSEVDGGYLSSGHQWVKRTGRVRDGKLNFVVPYRYMYDDGTEYAAGYEEYREGGFVRGEDYNSGEVFYTQREPIAPGVWHTRAEAMVSKRCTVDDHVGFSQYIADRWQLDLAGQVRAAKDKDGDVHLYLSDDNQQWAARAVDPEDLNTSVLEFTISVSKDGAIQSVSAENNFGTSSLAERMFAIVEGTEYWVPSWNGEFIDDELTIEINVLPMLEEGVFVLHDLRVSREKGW